jgi:hypothetical protein
MATPISTLVKSIFGQRVWSTFTQGPQQAGSRLSCRSSHCWKGEAVCELPEAATRADKKQRNKIFPATERHSKQQTIGTSRISSPSMTTGCEFDLTCQSSISLGNSDGSVSTTTQQSTPTSYTLQFSVHRLAWKALKRDFQRGDFGQIIM